MLIYSLILLLLSNAVNLRRDFSIIFSRVSILLLTYSILLGYNNLHISSINKGIGIYSGLFNISCYTSYFHIFMYILAIIILLLTAFYPIKIWKKEFSFITYVLNSNYVYKGRFLTNEKGENFKIIEYSLIIIFVLTGASLLISTSDIVSIFLSIELQSYGLYLFSTIYRNSEFATSGGLTYFLLGGLSSCFILLGASLLYANSGTTSLDNIFVINHLSELSNDNLFSFLNWYQPNYIYLSLLLISVGFLFKISAAPFHFWSPDVYDAIPTIVTTFVAIIAKVSILILFLELVYQTGNNFITFDHDWKIGLLVSSLFSLIIGTVLGLTQSRIKRLYAYSTISHLGFILLSLSIYKIESIQSFIFYLMQYSISNLNAFLILIAIGYSLYIYTDKNKLHNNLPDKENSPIQYISQLKGYFYINSILSISFTITLFSFIGVPPLIGFFAKQNVLSAALNNGYLFMSLVAILTSVISAVYYLAIIKQIFFEKPDYVINQYLKKLKLPCLIKQNTVIKTSITIENIYISSSLSISISVLTLIMLLFMFTPQEWLSMANILALMMFNI